MLFCIWVFPSLLEKRVREVFEEEGNGIQSLLLIQNVVVFVVIVVDFLIYKLIIWVIRISRSTHCNVGLLELKHW